MKPLLVLFICLFTTQIYAQDPLRFADEVETILNRNFERNTELPLVVFTGSSSIRMWQNVGSISPGFQIVNNGFGGSEFSDLIHFKHELIYSFEPDYLFLYEGDNDVSSGKTSDEILADAMYLLNDIKEQLPDTRIFLISPKPSISRWHLKEEYLKVNQALALLAQSADYSNVTFIDVWTPMMDENGVVKNDLFLNDDLHMNEKGYEIWQEVIGKYLPTR